MSPQKDQWRTSSGNFVEVTIQTPTSTTSSCYTDDCAICRLRLLSHPAETLELLSFFRRLDEALADTFPAKHAQHAERLSGADFIEHHPSLESLPVDPESEYSPDPAQRVPVALCPCKHTFHRECIRQWTEIRATCPLCRAKVGWNPWSGR
ncbi:hypothetical protein EJ04DRAFT_365132 [Polyplosphaeria fusca]|uniref:RING-type domain-containing protein n=1 Tax=Polyplosphaeria fusca TaxID=682080 RepID=A0A9P4QQ32_9PLEO|nr:hypothetical protein EJ04DRAFT_365132 [Polyplosphaeria fusca]